jgi:RNA polymerase sigma factor (sigma-70 family)
LSEGEAAVSETRSVLDESSTTAAPAEGGRPSGPTPLVTKGVDVRQADGRRVADLVAAAANGDAGGWDALVDRFAGLVWSIARGYHLGSADAADVSQVVWLRLVESLSRIREPGSVGAWIASVTRHECLRVIRKAGREIPVESDTLEVAGTDDLDVALLVGEHGVALSRALDRLSPRCRTLMRVLMADPRPSYEEIAAALDIPIGSIGPTRQRCLDRLRASPELTAMRD